MIMFQLGSGDWIGTILWIFLLFLLTLFYPKMLLSQMLIKLGRSVFLLDQLTEDGKKMIMRKIGSRDEKVRKKINSFLDFFVISPVDLDPFGIIKKYEHIMNHEYERLKDFAREIAGNLTEEERANIVSGMSAEMNLWQITKTVKHYIELIKKTKSYQLGLIIQMQLPLIEKKSRALNKAVKALTNGWPIGDSIGPFIAAFFMKKPKIMKNEEVAVSKTKIEGKNAIVIKAKGPGARVGKIGRAVEKIVKKEKISKIITIDAASKLESEKTGSVAEGVGVAMGGVGVDRSYIEEVAVKYKIPIDSYIVKMSEEEALMPMKKEILDSYKVIVEKIKENVKRTKGKVLIVGVGNTCGIPNEAAKLNEVEKLIERNDKKLKKWLEEEEKQSRESNLFTPFDF